MISQRIQSLLESEVTREEFLKYIGVALLSLIGITGIIRNLHQISPHKPSLLKDSTKGYGNSPYGH